MLALVRDQRGRAYLTRAQEGISGGPNRRLLKKLKTNGCIESTNSKLPNQVQMNEMEVLLRKSISESAHKVEGIARESLADGGPGYLVCVAVDEFGKPVFIKAETELKLGAVTHGSGALILHGQLMPKNEDPEDLAPRKASISGRFVLEDDEGNIFRVRATDLSPDGRDAVMQTMFRCVPASALPAVDDKERTPSAVPPRRNTIGR